LAAENQDLENSIAALRLEQARVQQEIALAQKRLESYIYPVLTLPNEIVLEIFVHFLPVYPECPPLTGVLSPTSLTHICRLWRQIAISTPMLWRAVALTDDAVSSQGVAHIIELWLERSRSVPLSIKIVLFDYDDVDAKALSSISAHRSHCEYLKLVPHDTVLFPAIEGSMPLLRHLHLESDEESPITINPVPFHELQRGSE
jgi:hypothetical protein